MNGVGGGNALISMGVDSRNNLIQVYFIFVEVMCKPDDANSCFIFWSILFLYLFLGHRKK